MATADIVASCDKLTLHIADGTTLSRAGTMPASDAASCAAMQSGSTASSAVSTLRTVCTENGRQWAQLRPRKACSSEMPLLNMISLVCNVLACPVAVSSIQQFDQQMNDAAASHLTPEAEVTLRRWSNWL